MVFFRGVKSLVVFTFSPLWIFLCFEKVDELVNDFSHTVHL